MIEWIKNQCCGCGVCTLVCPVGAITMQPKELGCLYPLVDSKKCINCRRCIEHCAVASANDGSGEPIAAYAAASKKTELLKRAASGGVFSTVAQAFLEAGGLVCGCALAGPGLEPKHILIADCADLYKLQGSKYVQSNIRQVLPEIKSVLQRGNSVLFSGTPCQIDALNHYLAAEDTTRLYTADVICHGTPSAQLFQDYLTFLGKGKIVKFEFRDKLFGWGCLACYSMRGHGRQRWERRVPPQLSSYYTHFLSGQTYRESCYSCRYAKQNRISDFTMGDFWGVDREYPELLVENGGAYQQEKGISALLVNTPKGKCFLDTFGKELQTSRVLRESIMRWNHQLMRPFEKGSQRDALIQAYEKGGYIAIEKHFRKTVGFKFIIRKIKWWAKTKLMLLGLLK